MATPGLMVSSANGFGHTLARNASQHIEMVKEALLYDDVDRLKVTARSLRRLCSAAASRRMKDLAAQLEECEAADLKTAIRLVLALEWELATLRRTPQAA